MASLLAGIKKKLPSRNTALFWGGVFGLVGFYKYNKNQSQKRLEYYCKRAEHVANEPIGALDTPRKVQVYIATPMGELGTRKARIHWERYVLPVFVAGALDYELILVNDTETINDEEVAVRGGVHNKVAEDIKERRRKLLEAKNGNEEIQLWRQCIDERIKENEIRELKNRKANESDQVDVSLWKPEPYPDIMDIVTIGRETWIEAINGISDGAIGSLNRQVPPLVQLKEEEEEEEEEGNGQRSVPVDDNNRKIEVPPNNEESKVDQITDTAGIPDAMNNSPQSTDNQATNNSKPVHKPVVINYDKFDNENVLPSLPSIAYISHFNRTGWGSLPIKIWDFFHDQQNVDLYCSQALQVVFESTRRNFTKADLDIGKAEEELPSWEDQHMDVVIDNQVSENLKVYETQKDVAPFKEEENSDN